jgi:spermidine synthase
VTLLAYFIFALSGAAGLIYESVWSRYLALMVGHTAYAQVLVLGIFLGGMALGAVLSGLYSERFHDPLKFYALAELIVGLFGLAFHWMYTGASALAYEVIFPAVGTGPLLTLVKWTLAAFLILPQAVILGTTFPLMAAAVLRRAPDAPGRVLGSLYFSNNMGAAVGVLVAGFFLLAVGGLPGSVLTAAGINVFVAAIAYGLALRVPVVHGAFSGVPEAAAVGERQATSNSTAAHLTQLLLAVSFGTAAASFCYEIGWLRMLALVLGSATHTFEIMLSAFILGLALGSFWVRTRADSFADPIRALGVVQWIMGLTALATLPLYAETFGWTEWMLQAFARSEAGYLVHSLGKYGVSLAIMLPSTICAGMTLPLITRTLLVAGSGEKSIGAVYGANTIGSIVGVALAGLVILPLVGVRTLIMGGAILDMAIGVALLVIAASAANRGRAVAYASAVLAVAFVLLVSVMPRVERQVLAVGVFRYGAVPDWMDEVRFYRDGRTATVSVYETSAPRLVVIATNGKADGSLPVTWLSGCSPGTARMELSGDAATQMLGPLLTLAHAPSARRAAIIGHGTGMSGHYMLGDPRLEEVTTVEIEPQMIEGSRLFYPANARVFDDPRSKIVLEDARTFFAAGRTEYDAIFAAPSNPWMSGTSSLFTSQFYNHVKRHLSDTGVFGQWLQLYEIDDTLVLSVMAGIQEQFASYALFRTSGGDLLILASKRSEFPVPDWSLFESPAFASDFCHTDSLTVDDLEATRVADDVVFRSLLQDWKRTNSDFHPYLDLGADRARFENERADGFLGLGTEAVDIAATLAHRTSDLPPSVRPPSANIARLIARSKAAYLRSLDDGAQTSTPPVSAFSSSRYDQELWRDMVLANKPPGDWLSWIEHFRRVEENRSGGVAGVSDDDLYGLALNYVEAQKGPNIVHLAVSYQRALAAWDFNGASRDLELMLLEMDRQGGSLAQLTQWIPATLLVEGGVVSKLLAGDRRGAANLYGALESFYPQSSNHLRRLLIESLLK